MEIFLSSLSILARWDVFAALLIGSGSVPDVPCP